MLHSSLSVLVLCTGNSARSVMTEALLNGLGAGRIRAYSAGSRPVGKVHPYAVAQVRHLGFGEGDFRSKSWDEFSGPDAPHLDLVITVCDNAADEACPVWHGVPLQTHWGVADPAAVTGDDAQRCLAFARTCAILERRVQTMLSLDWASLSLKDFKRELDRIGTLS